MIYAFQLRREAFWLVILVFPRPRHRALVKILFSVDSISSTPSPSLPPHGQVTTSVHALLLLLRLWLSFLSPGFTLSCQSCSVGKMQSQQCHYHRAVRVKVRYFGNALPCFSLRTQASPHTFGTVIRNRLWFFEMWRAVLGIQVLYILFLIPGKCCLLPRVIFLYSAQISPLPRNLFWAP